MTTKPSLAVYADLENISPKMVPVVVENLSAAWELTLKRAYVNGLSPVSRSMLRSMDFELIEPKRHVKRKNATDFRVTCDILEHLFLGTMCGFALLTSDSDFIEPVLKIKKYLPIYVFGMDNTPLELQRAATEFRLLRKPQPHPNSPDRGSTLAGQSDSERLRVLIASYVEEFSSTSKQLTVARFGAYLKQRYPEFAPTRYGAQSVSALLRRLGGFVLTEIRTDSGRVVDYRVALAQPQLAIIHPNSELHGDWIGLAVAGT